MPFYCSNGVDIIRARSADADRLGNLHYRAYYNRFFDPNALDNITGQLYGAPLAVEHPCLARGQDATYFNSYWQKFVQTLWNDSPTANLCYVATLGGQAVGFVKGNAAPPDAEIFARLTEPTPQGNVGELGSIYLDPAQKRHGYGRDLVTLYALELQGLGYDQMVTSAYYRNDSPRFFEKLGARLIGNCDIPNPYINYDKPDNPIEEVTIGGTLLYWDQAAFAALCRPGFKLELGGKNDCKCS